MLKHVHFVNLSTFSETHFMTFNEEVILKFTFRKFILYSLDQSYFHLPHILGRAYHT